MLPSGPVLSTCRQTNTFKIEKRKEITVWRLRVERFGEARRNCYKGWDRILTEVSSSGVECSKYIILRCQQHLFGSLYMCVKIGKANLAHILLPPEDYRTVQEGQQVNLYIFCGQKDHNHV